MPVRTVQRTDPQVRKKEKNEPQREGGTQRKIEEHGKLRSESLSLCSSVFSVVIENPVAMESLRVGDPASPYGEDAGRGTASSFVGTRFSSVRRFY